MTACVQSLHSTGVNTLYIDVWHNGQAYFKCPAIVGLLGTQGQAQDLLGWAVAAAAPLAMKVVAWLEYGLIAAPVNYTTPFSTLAHSRGWVLPGSFAGFTWMNAGNQHVLNFLSSLVTDLQHGYPTLHAIQFDDHFALPAALPGASVATMTAAAHTVWANASAISGLPPLTLSPATLEFALQEYSVDWAAWHAHGLFAMYTPQIYRTTEAAFTAELQHTVVTLGGTSKLQAGVRATGSPETSWAQLSQMLASARGAGVGAVVWDVRALTGVYHNQFKQLWG